MISIYCGKVEDLLSNFRSDFFDACLCDPPYGLKFMGKSWDHGVPSAEIWKLVKRTLKPGAPVLAFGGTRTYHRLAVAIEDAGFEIFDSILGSVWSYGTGFPKSLDISKAIDKAAGAEREKTGTRIYGDGHIQRSSLDKLAPPIGTFKRTQDLRTASAPATDHARFWDGYGTALKPAWEPIVCARKPLSGTYAENCIEHGCGGLNIDGCRVSPANEHDYNHPGNERQGPAGNSWNADNCGFKNTNQKPPNAAGRYPANLILSHHPECSPIGTRRVKSGKFVGRNRNAEEIGNKIYGARGKDTRDASYAGADGLEEVEAWECHPDCPVSALDNQSGCGASRFFYCSKVSTRERNAGLPPDLRCDHPTLKPIDLCRYLATLILPPARDNQHRNLLIPFAGAGSEIIGAAIAGWESISAIEKEYPYVEQAWYRVKASTGIEPVIFD